MLDTTHLTHTDFSAKDSGHQDVYAALDLGTNNCRLLIATRENHALAQNAAEGRMDAHTKPALKVLDAYSRIVRLGEDVSTSGKLKLSAMERTLNALQQCRKRLNQHNITKARFVATDACRRAGNRNHFLARVKEETGIALEVISTKEEAQLAFLGCASLLSPAYKNAIAFDIGGGSTEVMWIDINGDIPAHPNSHPLSTPCEVKDWLSIDLGVMNLADRFGGGAMADMMFNDMVELVSDKLQAFDEKHQIRSHLQDNTIQLLSTSGTATTLAAVFMQLPRYERTKIDGLVLTVDEMNHTIDDLLAMRPSERFNHPCIGADRADYIMAGAAIFRALTRLWPLNKITVADRGVREGIIVSLMQAGHGG